MESPVSESESESVPTTIVRWFVTVLAQAIKEHRDVRPGQRLTMHHEIVFLAAVDPVALCGLIGQLISWHFGFDCDFRVVCKEESMSRRVPFIVDGTFESDPANAFGSRGVPSLDCLLSTSVFCDKVIRPRLRAKWEGSMGHVVGFQLCINKDFPRGGVCDELLRAMISFHNMAGDKIRITRGFAGDLCIGYLIEPQ